MVVGAPFEQGSKAGVNPPSDRNLEGAGAAYVFVRDGSTWKQQAYLKASNPGEADLFGISVAIYRDTIVVGATEEDSGTTGINTTPNEAETNSGAVYVFVRDGTTWTQQAYIKASNTEESDRFARSISIWEDTIAVGADFESSSATGIGGDQFNNGAQFSGAVYVFVRSGTTWTQQAYIKASNTGAFDLFGRRLALSGETLVVGAPSEASNATAVNGNQADNTAMRAGAAYVFLRTGNSWAQQAYLKAFNAEAQDQFGLAVAISDDRIMVGAPSESGTNTGVNPSNSNGTTQAGAVYEFTRTGNVWSAGAYIKAPATSPFDFFGDAISLQGDQMVIATPGDDSAAAGVNGNPQDNSLDSAGAAVYYVREGSSWEEAAYLKASNPGEANSFGYSIGLFGDTIVVGASGEEGSGRGANPAVNESAEFAGAAYVFQVPTVLDAVAHSGYRAAGGTDLFYGKLGLAAMTETGAVLFDSSLTGAGSSAGRNQGIFSGYGTSGDQVMVMQKGAPLAGVLGLPVNAKVTGLTHPQQNQPGQGLFMATVSGTGVSAAGNRVLFCDGPQGVSAIHWTGKDVPELSDFRLRSIYEVLQHQSDNRVFLPYKLGKGAATGLPPASEDSGILQINHAGAVQDITMAEGNAADGNGKIGQVRPNASVTSHPQMWSIAKYVFNDPQDGAPYDSLYRNASAVPILPGSPAAIPLVPSATLGSMLSVSAQTGHGVFRSTLKNALTTQNEALYRTDGTSVFNLLAHKGSPLNPVPGDPTLTMTKLLRYWAVGTNQVVVHMQVSGTNVTTKNNEALVLLQANGFALILMRTGDAAPGMNSGVTIGKMNVIDVEHGDGSYFILATLKGIGSSGNLALFRGSTSAGDDAFTFLLRKPQLLLRKGSLYRTGNTPTGTIRSISVKPAPDATGVGARGLREVIGGNQHIAITITGDRNSTELVSVQPD
jgi:hypothetical protein